MAARLRRPRSEAHSQLARCPVTGRAAHGPHLRRPRRALPRSVTRRLRGCGSAPLLRGQAARQLAPGGRSDRATERDAAGKQQRSTQQPLQRCRPLRRTAWTRGLAAALHACLCLPGCTLFRSHAVPGAHPLAPSAWQPAPARSPRGRRAATPEERATRIPGSSARVDALRGCVASLLARRAAPRRAAKTNKKGDCPFPGALPPRWRRA